MCVSRHLSDPRRKIPVRSTQRFSVILPNEMAQMVKAKVSSGEYASESEVVCDGLRALQASDRALESCLRTEGAAAYDKLRADPSRTLGIDQVRQNLAHKRKRHASV